MEEVGFEKNIQVLTTDVNFDTSAALFGFRKDNF
jgi:hypothetical protein